MSYLKVDDIVNIVVSTAAAATPRDGFNVGLIVGKSSVINTTERCKIYSGVGAMLDDGFTENSPEYKAALLYFGQTPTPSKVVIGVCGSDETYVQAITACRAANNMWYAVYIAKGETAITTSEHQAVATYINGLRSVYFFDDKSADAIDPGKSTDVFSVIKSLTIRRAFGLYSTTDFAGAGAMGFAMGANDGTANSAYTMAYKSLSGVTPDDLSETAVSALQAKNANYYVVRGGTYNVLEKGNCMDGTWFDEVIGIDQLANDMQLGCMDLLANTKTKIPFTDAGSMQFVLSCNDACDNAVRRGFLAPGVWTGANILDLETGDTLEAGYLCQAEPVSDQPASSKSLRVCPPIYVSAIIAGAIHAVTIKVNLV